jgi:hypothetical protein
MDDGFLATDTGYNPEKRPSDPLNWAGNLPPCPFILSIQGNTAIIAESIKKLQK